MLKFLSKFSWWVYVGIVVLLLVMWQSTTNGALIKQVINNFKSDQTRIIEIKEENEKWYEDEIAKRDERIANIQKEKEAIAMEKREIEGKIADLEGRNKYLEDKIENIIVGNDPSTVIESLRKRFPSIRRR